MRISSENKLIYLAGDFNIDILKNNEKYNDDFLDLIYSYSLYPLIFRPTCVTDKSETLIDNILTNDLNNVGGILMFDTSDHLPNFSMTKKKIYKDDNHKIRDLSNKNINSLRGVEWVHDLFLFPLVLGKMKLPHAKLGLFCVV